MEDILIVGAGGMGREVLQIIKDINKVKPTFNIIGFLDDNLNALNDVDCDYKIICTIKDYVVKPTDRFALAIGDIKPKKAVVKVLQKKGAVFTNVIHPTARLTDFMQLGKGIVIYAYAKLSVNIKIGDYVAILRSDIGHDAEIGDFSTICGNTSINGYVKVGNGVFVGANSAIVPKCKIGDDSFVGIGSVVVKNVKPNTMVFGNPATVVDW